jgi:uncharacterized protein
VPAVMLATSHGILTGASYLGTVQVTFDHRVRSIIFLMVILLVLLIRWRWLWSLLAAERFYTSTSSNKSPGDL